jgi:hypothetical protein
MNLNLAVTCFPDGEIPERQALFKDERVGNTRQQERLAEAAMGTKRLRSMD